MAKQPFGQPNPILDALRAKTLGGGITLDGPSSQAPFYVVITDDATPTEIFTYTPIPTVIKSITGSVYAICSEEDCAALYLFSAGVHLDRNGAVVIVAEHVEEVYEDRPAWDVSIEVNGTSVNLLVTGEAGYSIQWVFTPGALFLF